MKQIVLFGASKLGEIAFDLLNSEYQIIYYCDNNSDIWGKRLNNIEILSPSRLKEIKGNYEVIITSMYLKEIELQLVNELNILNYKFFSMNISSTMNGKGYLNRDWVLENAKKYGDIELFLESLGNKVGRTKRVLDKISEVIDWNLVESVCEIGPGSGIFTRRVIEAQPNLSNYMIYEPDVAWVEWIVKNFDVTRRIANGASLEFEEDQTMSLVHAHAVFVYLNPIDCFAYFREMIRVTKSGGYIIFDFLALEGLDSNAIDGWLISGHRFPQFISERVIREFFIVNGALLIGEFKEEYANDFVNYHIYQVQ
ncbi:class I SAM-dependent methyltransferase [Lysinibacillus fusiformis]|uniref:class I SAM-dependent methyltransferase n=1 Tax=Lysinibacillus fusiformis TaxID=28031 RepID=UPI0037F2EE1B